MRGVGGTTAPEPESDKDLDSCVGQETFARINYFAFAGLFLAISPGRWHGHYCLISPLSERYIRLRTPCDGLQQIRLTLCVAEKARTHSQPRIWFQVSCWWCENWTCFGCIWMEKSWVEVKRWRLECWRAGVCGQNSQVVLYINVFIV